MAPKVGKIVVVFKSHFDFGFTGLPHEVLESYTTEMIPRALSVWEQTRHLSEQKRSFVWTLPAWVLHTALEMLDDKPDGKRLVDAVEQGGVVWHALPFTTHSELLNPEVLIRGLWYGRDLSERFGRVCISAKMTDVPGHTSFIPSLLAGAGIRFLHLGSNSCSTPPDVPQLFRWEGPDGGSVITMYSKGGYGSGLLPNDDWNLPVWLALQHTMDNEGPQDSSSVHAIFDELGGGDPGIEIVSGGLDDFAESLLEHTGDLPVVRGDLADSWIHGIGSMPAEVAKARSTMNRLPSAQYLLSRRGETAATTRSYESMLLFGEHTFGLDTKIALNPQEFGGRVYRKEEFQRAIAAGGYRRIIESWRIKADYAKRASSELEESLSHLQGDVGRKRRVRIFNPHPWDYRGPVELTSAIGNGTTPIEAHIHLPDGSSPEGLCVKRDNRWYLLSDRLPAPAETRIEIRVSTKPDPEAGHESWETVALDSGNVAISNGFLEIAVDAGTGTVSSLFDRRQEREWAGIENGPFGEYRYDVYGKGEILAYLKSYAYDLTEWYLADFGKPDYPRVPHECFAGILTAVSVRRDPGVQEIICRFRGDERAQSEFGEAAETTLRITLYDHLPWVEMEYRLGGKQATPFLESGHVVFPVNSQRPAYSVKRTGGVIDPTSDIPRNANRKLMCCDDWIDVSDEQGGLLVVPFDAPLVSIGEPAISSFDGDYQPKKPVLYFNLFNNQWGTNFPQWIEGDFTFRFRLLPHSGGWRDAGAYRAAGDALRPPTILGESGPRSANGLAILPDGMQGLEILSLRCVSDGESASNAVIARLREANGESGTRELAFSTPTCRVFLLNLMERSPEEVEVKRGRERSSARIAFNPFQIRTLRIETDP